MLTNIPKEMRLLKRWVRATKNKIPIDPNSGKAASPTDPKTWSSYKKAFAGLTSKQPFIGFVLSEKDPFTIIDLDDPYKKEKNWSAEKRKFLTKLNQRILDSFDSYAEISQSGKGYHIIIRGNIPRGVRRDTVEVYSSQRYMICTGNVEKSMPINKCQETLDALYNEMNSTSKMIELIEVEEKISDVDVVNAAMYARNGDKFNSLCKGDLSGYPSQSEADFALLSIIAFYTKSNEQVRRLFRMSALGKREKAMKNDSHLDRALAKIRAKQPPEIDFEQLTKNAKEMLATSVKEKVKKEKKEDADFVEMNKPKHLIEKEIDLPTKYNTCPPLLNPPGLLGDIANYIFESSVRPVREVGLVAAIGMMAGIVGRQYNISGTGLNQYLIFLARTGTGKEGIASGIDRVFEAVRSSVPSILEFRGPSAFASGPALVKTMAKKNVFLSILGEFGLTLQQLCDPRAMGAHVSLRHAFLDLYQKSGWYSILRASVYSDQEKNTGDVQAPALTLLGESTPETFLDGLSEHHIADGLIPRFTTIEYSGKRPYLNVNNSFAPPEELTSDLIELVTNVLTMAANNAHMEVKMTKGAQRIADEFETWTTDLINRSAEPVLTQLWNRAHLKALKMAALIAVGVNHNDPIITKENMSWALSFVKKDIDTLLVKFESGEVGHGELKLETDVRRKIELYFSKRAKGQYKRFMDKNIIPQIHIRQAVGNLAAFKRDPRGITRALQVTMDAMVSDGVLLEIPLQRTVEEFNTSAKMYAIGEMWHMKKSVGEDEKNEENEEKN